MKKKFFLIFGISFILFWGMAVLRGGYVTIFGISGGSLSALAGFLAMWGWSYFAMVKFKQLKPIYIILAIWLGISILELPGRNLLNDTLVSLPTYLLWCFGIAAGYLSYLLIKKKHKIALILSMAALLFIGFWSSTRGYDLFLNKLNFGSYTGNLSEKIDGIHVEFQDGDGRSVRLADLHEDYLMFDVWSSTCGVCFEKFPHIQSLYDSYAQDARIGVYGLHSRMEKKNETASKGSEILTEMGYTFPNLSIRMDDPVLKELGVECYPTILIFDTKRNLTFRGDIESVETFISKQLSEK